MFKSETGGVYAIPDEEDTYNAISDESSNGSMKYRKVNDKIANLKESIYESLNEEF